MATIKGIIAGISIDKANEIPPEFDAMIYKHIIGQNGHSLSFSSSGTTLTVNGIVIADGMRGYFNNEQITIGANGYLYVKFTTYHNLEQVDTVELEWSTTALVETHDNIGSVAGIYRMNVLTVANSQATTSNTIIGVQNAENAENAEIVTTTIAAGATGTTPATSDNSTKVATTAFVQAAATAKLNEFASATLTLATNASVATNSIKKQGRSVIIDFDASSPSQMIEVGNVVATIPIGFRPTNDIIVYSRSSPDSGSSTAIERVQIKADGSVIAYSFDWGGGYTISVPRIKFNVGFITA